MELAVVRTFKMTALRMCLAASVGLAAALFAPFMSSEANAQSGSMCVTNVASWDTLNVRTGPGTRFPVINQLAHNFCGVNYAGSCQGSWCPVGFPGGSGWVNSRFLMQASGARPGGGGAGYGRLGNGPHCVTGVAFNDQLNVRSGPSTRFPVIAGMSPGFCGVYGTGQCQGNWCEIANHEFTGWVNIRFLSPGR